MSDVTDERSAEPSARTRREIVLGSLFLAAAGVTAARMPDRPLDYLGDNKLDNVVPEEDRAMEIRLGQRTRACRPRTSSR